jgi:hypothetical protein
MRRDSISLQELANTLFSYKPDLLHFSGHGTKDGALVVLNDDKSARLSAEALGDTIRILNENTGKRMRGVILNAAYSEKMCRQTNVYNPL